MCLPQSRLTFLVLLGHGVHTPPIVTFQMPLLGLFLGLIVLRPMVSTWISIWRNSLLYVFAFIAFIVQADTHCSVILGFVPISEEPASQCLTISCIWAGGYSYGPDLGFFAY